MPEKSLRDDTPTDLLRSNLGLVNRADGGRDTDGETGNDSASAEHANILRGALDDGADYPDNAGQLQGDLSGQPVGEEGRSEGADQGAGGHGGRDGALCVRDRMAEIVLVGGCAEDTAHGADIKTEESTA